MTTTMKYISSSKRKQKGATLMTVMTFLVLMTVVSVSATKISILDVLVSGNDQQRIIAFQAAENNLAQFAKISSLNVAFSADGFNNPAQQYKTLDSNNELSQIITDMTESYPCEREGSGSSMGASAPPCSLYDFQILLNQKNTGARENHHRGGGKMVPNQGSKGSLL